MNVLHIIPSAFNYFDDIRDSAFALLEALPNFGVQVEAFTLQYGTTNSREMFDDDKTEAGALTENKKANKPKFIGMVKTVDMIDSFAGFDIIHVHCPLLGAAGKLYRWKQNNPAIPLVATYYHPVRTPDFFSLGIVWYNGYYLPKLFTVSDIVTYPSADIFRKVPGYKRLDLAGKLMEINASSDFLDQSIAHLAPGDSKDFMAMKYSLIYDKLLGV